MRLLENVPLREYTTFEIGGNARYFIAVSTEADIRESLSFARVRNLSYWIIGGGSNILVPDEGLPGVVIHFASNDFELSEGNLKANAGCTLLSLIRASADAGFGGWEKLSGIPGTLGGAVRGNAGAFGPEIKDFVTYVRALHATTEDVHEFSNAECAFEYRMSFFKRNSEWIILDVHLALEPGDTVRMHAVIAETIAEREKRHIQNVKAAGSYFVNPVAPLSIVNAFEAEKKVQSRGGRVPAGWLIEKAGLKGMHMGGAQVSPQQANYIINAGGATAAEVRTLSEKVKEEVHRQFHVALTEEAVVF